MGTSIFCARSILPALSALIHTHTLVILDNASIHHVAGAVDMIQTAGALAYFLSPYRPDLNAIEHTFSKVKSH